MMPTQLKKFFLCLVVTAVLVCVVIRCRDTVTPAAAPERFQDCAVVIDAGHGGEDGGAISLSGRVESGLNLSIALKLDQLMGLYGVRTTMLRTEDVSLHSPDAETLRQKKASDLRNRVAMVEEAAGATLISIHQNSYPSSRYSGAQVFYSPTSGSRELAEQMQEVLRLMLDPSNDRQAAQVAESVYLMNHVDCRAILIECGFLTNPDEEARLASPDYQTKLAAAICGGYLQEQIEKQGDRT